MDEGAGGQARTNEMISVARVCGSQGRRGEVAVEIKTDFPERFAPGVRFLLAKSNSASIEPREYVVENAWPHKGKMILKFAGVDSISDAEALSGLEVLIAHGERKRLPEGNYYLDDLIGCRVIEGERDLGQVADWEDTGGGILLHVVRVHVDRAERRSGDDEILIPFAEDICTDIDTARRAIQVRLPEGLLDLNSAAAPKPLCRN